MQKTVLITGFPGFIATRLFHALKIQNPETHFKLLVHPSQLSKASPLVEAEKASAEILIGDITKENLDLLADELEELRQAVTHVFHLAAIYDLAVPQQIAHEVNVIGTKNMNNLVASFSELKRYIYFSTAYVSGLREGRILEGELDAGQTFKNHYEETKFLAEKSISKLGNVPTTIIRPGVIVGDSSSGETIKFDGPYFIMRFLDRFRLLPIPYIGTGKAKINIVPVDFIMKATLFLSDAEEAINQTFHLCDPKPYTANEAYRMVCEELLEKKPRWTISIGLVRQMLSITPIRRWMRVEKETIDYFDCLAEYDCSIAENVLSEAGIHCPNLKQYLPNIIAYYKQHRADENKMIPVR